jgi:hypothetical protein
LRLASSSERIGVDFLIVLAILTLVVLVVSAPLRREATIRGPAGGGPRRTGKPGGGPAAAALNGGAHGRAARDAAAREAAFDLADLQAARDAKYREIRDAELDHRTGKLSDPDYDAIDAGLRAEAIEILRALDRAMARSGATIGER